mgnify:CR=1 FL=1
MLKTTISISFLATFLFLQGCTVTIGSGALNDKELVKTSRAENSSDKDFNLLDGSEVVQSKKDEDLGQRDLKLEGESFRNQSIENAFYTYSFQKTVFSKYRELLSDVEPFSDTLDEIFNFKKFVYDNKMLPPIVEESNDYLGKQSNNSMVKTTKRWKIVKDARVVINVPTWRDYFLENVTGEPNEISNALIPKTGQEKKYAEKGRDKGTIDGEAYAVTIFQTNLDKLKKDYLGMITYKKLELQNIVGKPVLAMSKEPFIYSNKNKELMVDTNRYLITQESSFQRHEDWKPVVPDGFYFESKDDTFSPPGYVQSKQIQQ